MSSWPLIICWDLDHTLGNFTSLILDRGATSGIRHGISGVLERLAQLGVQHVLTTTGSRLYASSVLERTGLRHRIPRIFSGDEIDAGSGKRYRPVAQAFGLTDLDAVRRMVVIGDLIYDQPADIDGLVFVHQPAGYCTEAVVLEDLLARLLAAGSGDVQAGFVTLHTQMGAPLPLPDGCRATMQWRNPHASGPVPRLAANLRIPLITIEFTDTPRYGDDTALGRMR
ncbi:MAG TPA: HAD family hydrolase [Chloroflexota bacterium]|nr:HAD family hydrolase [Chloroflexota bacterium]